MRSTVARRRRILVRAIASIFAALPAGLACSAPQGAQVVAGSAAVSSVGSTLLIHQSTNRAIINWSDFSINSSETVKFVLPSSSSAVLNRVMSLNPSELNGTLSSNGNVYLINPNGILIGPSGVIDVHSFVASSLNVNNTTFMAGGDLLFSGNSAASVINQGIIKTPTGDVVMIAQQVRNDGQITAVGGSVHLVGGQQVLLQQSATPGMTVRIIAGNGFAGNTGVIQATLAELAASGGNAMALAINNTGIIRATGVQNSGGHIYLTAGGGQVNNNGTLDASSSTGAGGQIIVTGQDILIGSQSLLNADGATGGGQILVGGSWQNDDPSIPQAIGAVVLNGAVLEASATQSGNGGMVVVRSDVSNADSVTRAYGSFLASGAGPSGDGGQIETSGYWLDTAGSTVSAAASGGKAGQWLLDPFDMTVTTSPTSNFNIASNPWVPTASGGDVAASDIDNALNLGSNVTISTGASGTDLGNITDDAAIAKTSGGTAVMLTFQASNNITINQPISSDSGALNIVLQAHQGAAGAIILGANLTTNGGSISFGTGQTSGGALIGGDVYLDGGSAQTLSTSGGNVTVAGQMLIANPSGLTINTAGGAVDFQGTVDSGDSYVLVNTATTWDNALVLARGSTAGGAAIGDTYLATITSSLENTIASAAANYNPAWLGGERVLGIGTNAVWRWVTGPEGLQNSGQGMEFFTSVFSGGGGTPINGAYSNWNPGEPNNSGGANVNQNGETVLQFVGTAGLWNDLNESSPTNPYLVETNLTPSPLTVNAGAGQVTFAAAVGSNKALGSLTVTGPLAMNGGGVITTGAQTYNNAITLGSTATVLSVTNADLNLGQSMTYSGGTAATLTLQASGSVILGPSTALSATGAGAMSVTIDSHNSAGTDTGNSGAIVLGTGDSIITKGGSITLGGGVSPLTVPAYGTVSNIYGIDLNGATLNSAGGNITLTGIGVGGTSSSAVGVLVDAASSITAAGGAVSITGIGGANSANDNTGVLIQAGSSIATTSGPLSISGTGGGSAGTSANDGVSVENSTITSASGAIGITGAGGVGTNSNGSSGISFLSGASSIQSTGISPILLSATPGTGAASIGISAVAPASIGGASDSGNITVNSDSVAFDNSGAAVTFQSSAQLLIEQQTPGASVAVGSGVSGTLDLGSAAVSNIHSGFSQVIIGSASGTGAVAIGTAVFNDAATIRSPQATVNDLSVNGALSATTGAITLQAGRSIIENTGASITTNDATVSLDADANADQNGNIQILGGTITTNGGAMLLGGGGSPSTTAAFGVTAGGSVAASSGIFLDQATLDSAGGNISLRGAGVTSAAPPNAVGVMIEDSTSIDSGTGMVFIFGTSAIGGTGGNMGVEIGYQNTLGTGTPGVTGSSITSSSTSPNAIIISGTGSTSGASDSAGITLQNGSSVTTTGTGGGVTLSGTGGTGTDNSNPGNQGISLDAGTTISSTGGNVTLNATASSGVTAISNFNTGAHTISADPTTGIITLNPSSGGADLDSTTLTASQLLLTGSGNVTLTDPSNSISTIAGNVATGNVQVTNSANLTVGTVSSTSGLTATGGTVTLVAQGASSNLVLNQPVSATGTGSTVVLSAGQNFINNAGPSAIDPGTGRFLVYATDPTNSAVGGLSAGHLYNSTYTNYPPASVTETGNQILYGLNAVLTFTATDKTRVYGQPTPTLTYTFAGLVGGDTISQAVTGSPALSTTPDSAGVGDYPIAISAGTLVSPLRYQFNFVGGNLSVTPAPLTITAVDVSKLYGAPLPTFTANYTTLVNGDSASAISGLIFTTPATAASNVGPYTITPSGGTSPNYTISFAPGTLTVTPAPLTIFADDKSRAADANNPALTATFRTLVNGDQTSVITGLVLSTTADFQSSPGDYPIQISGGADANYAITLVNGTMDILNIFTESLQAEQQTATGLIPNFATGSVGQTNTNILPETGSNVAPANGPSSGHSAGDVFYRDVAPFRNSTNGRASVRLERLLRDAFTHVSSYDVKGNENSGNQ